MFLSNWWIFASDNGILFPESLHVHLHKKRSENPLGISPMISSNIVLASTIFVSLCLVIKIIRWHFRFKEYRQRMPFIPILFPPESLFRVLWPRKWQTYHFDWHLHLKAKPYQLLNSDIFALVSLFGHDTIVVRDPDAYVQMRITEPEHYPKDLHQVQLVWLTIEDYGWQFRLRYMVPMLLLQTGKNGDVIVRLFPRHSVQKIHKGFILRQWDKPSKCYNLGENMAMNYSLKSLFLTLFAC